MTKYFLLYPLYNFGRHTGVLQGKKLFLQQSVTFFNRTVGSRPRALSETMCGIIPKHNLNCSEETTSLSKACFHDDCDSDDSDSENLLVNGSRPMPSIDVDEEETATSAHRFHSLLQPESDDVVIRKLNACASVQEVFNVVREYKSSMNALQTSQAVLVLWNIQKFYFRANAFAVRNSLVDIPTPIADKCASVCTPQSIGDVYVYEINTHEDFVSLLQLVEKIHEDLSADLSACCLLYLNRMGVNLNHPAMQKLILHCEKLVNNDEQFPLTALSRFTVAVNSYNNDRLLWATIAGQRFLPAILNTIDRCENAQDFKLLTICLNSIHRLIGISTLKAYKKKAEQLLEMKLINENTRGAIIKAIVFLNRSHWALLNHITIQRLMLVLKGHISKLSPTDVVRFYKVFENHLEPADMLDEIQEHGTKLIAQAESEDDSPLSSKQALELLSCLVLFSPSPQKKSFEELVKHHIESAVGKTILVQMFYVLRSLKTSNRVLCDTFWSRTVQKLEEKNFNQEDYILSKMSQRYMHFNNNLAGTYRHSEFETKLKSWLLKEIKYGISGLIPSKFAQAVSFLIAYSSIKHNSQAYEEDIAKKIVEMVPQFTTKDCANISRGLRISMEIQQVRNMSSTYVHNFVIVNAAMNDFTEKQLQNEEISLHEVTTLMRAFNSRKGPRGTQLCSHLLERIRIAKDPLSSRLIRDLVYSLQVRSFHIPEIIDRMVEYVIQNNSHILGDTAEKLLYHCYLIGYTPLQTDAFLAVVADLILRDKEKLTGVALLNGALALCFFQRLPVTLIDELFTVEFLERLDDEISNCYSKATYPYRIRRTLMELNRAVCLDYPDADIPWFHKKFCEEMKALEGTQDTTFFNDVFKSLVDVVGSKQLISTHVYSPYFYKIDFQIALNDKNNPVLLNRHSAANNNITRVAILLYKTGDYCSNVNQLIGPQLLKKRHLEILGYRVVGISATIWHSMFMAEPMAKSNYLHERIWPTVVR